MSRIELAAWPVETVCAWLRSTSLGEWATIFEEHDIDGALLVALDDEILQEMGVASKLARKKLLTRIQAAKQQKLTAVSKPRRSKSSKSSSSV